MVTITAKKHGLQEAPTDYCRLILTEEPASTHRFVETTTGSLEYRLGVGKYSDVTMRTFRTLIRNVVQIAKNHQIEKLAVELPQAQFPQLASEPAHWYTSTIAENALLAAYEYNRYKTKKDKKKKFTELLLCGVDTKEEISGAARGKTVAEFTNAIRDLANTPGNDLSPSQFGEAAKKLLKIKGVTVTVRGEKELKKLKMGLHLAVGAGTKSESKLIVAEYWGAGKPSGKKTAGDKQPIILIGKGITFDSGGLNVKPGGSMHDMHMDMAGGASVLGALGAAATLGLKKNIIAIVPAAENAISDDSMRAGDIVTAMNGLTVEVMHTDAEGRMVLADALTFSQRYSPRAIIDVATLTGAALVALGTQASALLTKDKNLSDRLMDLSERSGDLIWPLPLWDEYKQYLKSSRADLTNVDPTFARSHGCIEGGIFLSYFAPKGVPFAHLDIAPRMESVSADKLAKGATGEPVRLLVSFLETY
ncbi:leucyl aminopeptidase family protein [Patescibacteria group bacterium]|nr:leucyl aminopeptidase family protein [Patescibacteria group bacterium]